MFNLFFFITLCFVINGQLIKFKYLLGLINMLQLTNSFVLVRLTRGKGSVINKIGLRVPVPNIWQMTHFLRQREHDIIMLARKQRHKPHPTLYW